VLYRGLDRLSDSVSIRWVTADREDVMGANINTDVKVEHAKSMGRPG
jgi:hypothetical protein